MFSSMSMEQWGSRIRKWMLVKDDFIQMNFEDIQSILPKKTSIMEKGESIERNAKERVDSTKWEPLLITTIPITFMTSHVKRGGIPLIEGTVAPEREEAYINELLDTLDSGAIGDLLVVVYGQNAMDKSVIEKARQLKSFGFSNVCIYPGGMFEWCLLQDVYGNKEFPIAGSEGGVVEPLLYKGKRALIDDV
jgi:hypothetical protein